MAAETSDRRTTPTDADVTAFTKAEMYRALGAIGFGRQAYRTADGKEREWFAVGLSPRKAALTLYGLTYDGSNADLLERLGPHTTGKGCLYVKHLEALDRDVFTELVRRSWETNRNTLS